MDIQVFADGTLPEEDHLHGNIGYIPPGTRQEKLSGVPNLPRLHRSYNLEETQIQSSGRVKLSTLVISKKDTEKPDCVVLYLQGSVGNPLHRIPVFESLFSSTSKVSPIIVAPAPRSYWSSSKRKPTQKGILTDYRHALRYIVRRWPDTPIALYGHSLGGAVAVCLLASLDEDPERITEPTQQEGNGQEEEIRLRSSLRGLVLENPFASIPGMVHALYPQRWLPYRHLAPFAWDKWDALGAMHHSSSKVSDEGDEKVLSRLARNMLLLVSAKDEIVPPSMGHAIFDARLARSSGDGGGEDRARLVEIDGALHEDAWRLLQWKKEMGRYLEEIIRVENEH